MRPLGLLVLLSGSALITLAGCEKQLPARSAEAPPPVEDPIGDDEIDTDALSRPGSGDYFRAVSGARGSAERLKDRIGDYNRQVEEQADEVFND